MSFNKTALKKMKKDALVEHILKIQKEQATSALLSSSDEETSTEAAVFPKEEELQRLERVNQGHVHVNIDILWKLREEKKHWEKEQKTEIEKLEEKVDELESHACSSLSLYCDCCQSSITEDDLNMSIEKRCGKLLCEECCDSQDEDDEAQKWKKMYEEAIAERNTESQMRSAESEKNARYLTKWSDLAASMKKEIEELKDRNDELEDYYCDREDKLNEEIDELKEEIKKLKIWEPPDYKNFGVMMETEDEDEEDCGYFDTLEDAKVQFKETMEENPTARVVIFITEDRYNPDYDNIGTITIVEENREE